MSAALPPSMVSVLRPSRRKLASFGAMALFCALVSAVAGCGSNQAPDTELPFVLQGRVAFRGQEVGALFAAAGDVIHFPQAEACTYEGVGEEPSISWAVTDSAGVGRRHRACR